MNRMPRTEIHKTRFVIRACILLLVCIASSGCGTKFWDPTQVGRFRPVPAVNVILDSLGVAEETPAAWETGEEPRPADIVAYDTDYVFGPGDVVQISIFELYTQGAMYVNQFVITETGKMSIPDIGVIEAAGLTESQLEEEIKQILSPTILKEPSVSVSLIQSQSRIYSILGNGVPSPGRYGISRYDYRLTDALAAAGGISQFNISYIYISRPITGEEAVAPSEEVQPEEGPAMEIKREAPAEEPREEMLEILKPYVKHKQRISNDLVVTSAEMITDEELAELNRIASPENISPPENRLPRRTELRDYETDRNSPADSLQPENEQQETNDESRIEWIFQDGRWVPVRIGPPAARRSEEGEIKTGRAPAEPSEEQPVLGWGEMGPSSTQSRVIKVPSDRLLSGDPRYNIVIKPRDNIHVPVDIIGEFCIMGNVNNQGFINMTGRPMTLKMAIAAAGGLGPLAWPKRCEVVRRIGKKREEIVMVDLDKIAMGEQPDFFIKPNDLINVGTHPTARFRAVLRNAFRASYGFGFIYDRNFADRDYGTARPFDFFEF